MGAQTMMALDNGSRRIGISSSRSKRNEPEMGTCRTFTGLSLALLSLSACNGEPTGPVEIPPTEWEISLELPADRVTALAVTPDERVYAGTTRALYRLSTDLETWELLDTSRVPIIALAAPNIDWVYALGRLSGSVYRWRPSDGIVELRTPLTDSVRQPSHGVRVHFPLFELWAKDSTELFAVGNFGAILHLKGEAFSIEHNPLVSFGDSSETFPRSIIWDVAGHNADVFAVGRLDILERHNGQWKLLSPPEEFEGPVENVKCAFLSVAPRNRELIVGGGETTCLYTRTGDTWRSPRFVPGTSGNARGGARQPDGSSVFWTGHAVLTVDSSGRLTTYSLPAFQMISSAVIASDEIYVGGLYNGRGTVIRFRHR